MPLCDAASGINCCRFRIICNANIEANGANGTERMGAVRYSQASMTPRCEKGEPLRDGW
ncbi:hypothetical protein BDI4_120202 [Burkholderia diffusa]|nr:hypothetical protein BDI4_120202 [Burkholderia diffusa]